MEPTTPLAMTLEAQQWNQLVNVLADAPAPWRITNPLIVKLSEQLRAVNSEAIPPQPLANGEDAHAPH